MTRYTITREDVYGFKTVRHADTAQGAALMHSMLESLPGTRVVTTHDPEDRITSDTVVGDGPERPDARVSSALDRQEGGNHYKDLKIQPVEYIHANNLPFIEGNVVKYITRWRAKGGVKDLEKARHYIDLLIELEQRKE